jgi:hypothetical protein
MQRVSYIICDRYTDTDTVKRGVDGVANSFWMPVGICALFIPRPCAVGPNVKWLVTLLNTYTRPQLIDLIGKSILICFCYTFIDSFVNQEQSCPLHIALLTPIILSRAGPAVHKLEVRCTTQQVAHGHPSPWDPSWPL